MAEVPREQKGNETMVQEGEAGVQEVQKRSMNEMAGIGEGRRSDIEKKLAKGHPEGPDLDHENVLIGDVENRGNEKQYRNCRV